MYIERWKKRQRQRTILACFFALLGVGALGTSTYAWFQAVRNQSLSVQSVQVETSVDLSIDYKFYGYDEDNRAGRELDFAKDPLLEEYDSFILERNENNNRILAVDVTFLKTIETDTNLVTKIVATGSFKNNDTNKVEEVISNIIYFRSLVISIDGKAVDPQYQDAVNAPSAADNPANEIYSTGKDLFDSLSIEKTPFVIATPVSGSYEFSKVEKNTLTFSTPIPAGSLTARVLIEFNYLDQLISLYEDQNLFAGGENWGTTSILGGNTITFKRDISTFRMDLVG